MMTRKVPLLVPLILIVLLLPEIPKSTKAQTKKDVPREWIDPDTGHRVVRLSDEPASQTLYFHQNAYTPDGEKLIITTPTGLSTVNLKTRAIEKVVEGRVNVLITGRKTGNVYFVRNRVVYATDLNTKATREIAKLPPGASVTNVNADETLLSGTIDELQAKAIAAGRGGNPGQARPDAVPLDAPQPPRADAYPGKGAMMERRLAERRPLQLITISIKTGEVMTLIKSTDWLNHIQFSPTDPTLL